MQATTLPWLDAMVGTVETIAITLLVIVNGAFALTFLARGSRSFVDRWTKPLLVGDAVLLLAAFGSPVVAVALKLAAKGLALFGAMPGKLVSGK
ncbi:MAG: hypothetical protein ABUL71_02100 [Gemmatimonadota bacterium]